MEVNNMGIGTILMLIGAIVDELEDDDEGCQ